MVKRLVRLAVAIVITATSIQVCCDYRRVMRDIASRANTEISRIYGSMSPETKLAFGYFLAVGMDEGTIIPCLQFVG